MKTNMTSDDKKKHIIKNLKELIKELSSKDVFIYDFQSESKAETNELVFCGSVNKYPTGNTTISLEIDYFDTKLKGSPFGLQGKFQVDNPERLSQPHGQMYPNKNIKGPGTHEFGGG